MRLLGMASIMFLLMVGSAYAGRGGGHGGGHRGGDHRGGRVVHRGGGHGGHVRDHRGGGGWHRGGPGPRHVHRGHVRYSGGRYMFPGGRVFVYKKPRHIRYYDVHVRPPILVETYDTIPGYVWVGGGWRWGGAEWVWTPGYYSVGRPSVGVSAGFSAGVTVR